MDARGKLIAALGEARLAPYLEAANGNRKKALQLYRWSLRLSASVHETVGITEVLVRNSVDRVLQTWNQERQPAARSWLLAPPAEPLRSLVEDKRCEAVRRARKVAKNRPRNHPRVDCGVVHDDVLAQTMFGLWKDLLPNFMPGANQEKSRNKKRRILWREAVSSAFPYEEDIDGQKTFWRVFHVHGLRNRVSHMDSLLNVDVKDYIDDAFALAGAIDPQLRGWVTSTSSVGAVLKEGLRVKKCVRNRGFSRIDL